MRFFLGLDGGGTGTRAMIVDASGRVLGEGQSGPGNYHNVGLDRAVENIVRAAHAAWEAFGKKPVPAEAAFAGCAGIRSSTDIARLTAALENADLAGAGDLVVANDLHNALAGGLNGKPGIALIAGTGSNCLGRDTSSNTWMCGGWGWLLDAPGSAFGLAHAAMLEAVQAADGRGKPGALLPALLAFLGLSDADEILARLYVEPWTAEELAAFAPVVVRCATHGDAAAKRVLREGARALAELVATTSAKLDFPNGPDVVILGGCARSGAPYQTLIEDSIRTALPEARLVDPCGSPVRGAALNALRLGGIPLSNL